MRRCILSARDSASLSAGSFSALLPVLSHARVRYFDSSFSGYLDEGVSDLVEVSDFTSFPPLSTSRLILSQVVEAAERQKFTFSTTIEEGGAPRFKTESDQRNGTDSPKGKASCRGRLNSSNPDRGSELFLLLQPFSNRVACYPTTTTTKTSFFCSRSERFDLLESLIKKEDDENPFASTFLRGSRAISHLSNSNFLSRPAHSNLNSSHSSQPASTPLLPFSSCNPLLNLFGITTRNLNTSNRVSRDEERIVASNPSLSSSGAVLRDQEPETS